MNSTLGIAMKRDRRSLNNLVQSNESVRRACNLCNKVVLMPSKFHRFCSWCKNHDHRYLNYGNPFDDGDGVTNSARKRVNNLIAELEEEQKHE